MVEGIIRQAQEYKIGLKQYLHFLLQN